MTDLLVVLCAVGALACAFQFGVWFVVDKARHIAAVEAFLRACYDATKKPEIAKWLAEYEAEEERDQTIIANAKRAKVTRIGGLRSRGVA